MLKEPNTALRIGANQGSLSDRVMSRYGDTPVGNGGIGNGIFRHM